MTIETRITAAFDDIATTVHFDDAALSRILERGRVSPPRHRTSWVLGGVGVAAVAIAAIVIATQTPQRKGDPDVAMIMLPSLDDNGANCGSVTARPAALDDAASVTYLPPEIPIGYELGADQPPDTYLQHRAVADIACWTADASYIDPATGSIVALSVTRQGNAHGDCEVPASYQPSTCTTVNDRPAGLVNFGARQTMMWTDSDGNFVSLDSYGLTGEELAAVAASVSFDGTNASLSAPDDMIEIENRPKTRSDDRDIVYFNAVFRKPTDDAAAVTVRVSTWNDVSINETGPSKIVDINGISAVAVTTGGPTTGIIGWTNAPDAASPLEAIEFEPPSHAYITWASGGLDFRIEGPDIETITQFAQALRPAQSPTG